MTDHLKVDNSFVQAIVENAAWDAARVSLVEKKDSGQKKGDKPKGKAEKDDDKPDFTTGARKGDDSKTKPGKKDFSGCEDDEEEVEEEEDEDEVEESVEAHVCPLCESTLDEALTDKQVSEHVSQIQDALNTLEEGDDDGQAALDDYEKTTGSKASDAAVKGSGGSAGEADAEADGSIDGSKKSKKSKKGKNREAVMTKVKELKKAASGK